MLNLHFLQKKYEEQFHNLIINTLILMVVLIVMYDLQLGGRDPGIPFQTDIGVHSVQFYCLCLGGHNGSGHIFFDVLHYNKHLL